MKLINKPSDPAVVKTDFPDKEAEAFLANPEAVTDEEASQFLEGLANTPEGRLLESGKSVLTTGGEALQVPGAAIRAPIISTLEGKGPMAGVQEFGEQFSQQGTGAVEQFSGEKLVGELGVTGDIAKPVAGFAAELVTDPLSYSANWLAKLAAGPLKPVAAKQVAKGLSKYVTKTQFTKEGINPELLGKYLVDRGVSKYINSPKKLKEIVSGVSETIAKGPEGFQVFKTAPKKGSGLIGAIYQNLSEELVSHSDIPTRNLGDIAQSVVTNFQNRMATDYAYPSDPKVAESIMKHVKDYLKLAPGGNTPTTSLPVKNLNDIRTMLFKKVSSKDFFNRVQAGDTGAILERDVVMGILDELKGEIMGALDASGAVSKFGKKTVPTSTLYEAQNSAMSQLIKLDTLLESEDLYRLKKSDIAQLVTQTLAGAGVGLVGGQLAGFPVQGAVAVGVYSGARKAMDIAKDVTPGIIAKGITGLPSSPALKIAPTAMAEMLKGIGGVVEGRSPQSVNIPEELVRTPVPRSTEEILQKKDFVKMKIAQMYPDMYEQVSETLDNYPEYIEDMLPLMAVQMPGLFPKDKYNRIDGKIFSPADKARAIRDVNKDNTLSTTQKALKIQKLNLTGEF